MQAPCTCGGRQRQSSIDHRRLALAESFTALAQAHHDQPIAQREAACLAALYPACCRDPRPDDIFVGRTDYELLVGFGNERNANWGMAELADTAQRHSGADQRLGINNSGFYHRHEDLSRLAADHSDSCPQGQTIHSIRDWWDEHSLRAAYGRALPAAIAAQVHQTTGFDIRHLGGFVRQDCYSLDYHLLLRAGLPGLRRRILAARKQASDPTLHDAMMQALDVLAATCRWYRARCLALATDAEDARATELGGMADTLAAIADGPPRTLRQAMQLFWLYQLVADTPNYGRMDDYLGEFLARDLADRRLSEAAAESLIAGLWRMIAGIRDDGGPAQSNARVNLGGRGRLDETAADRFALAALRVTRRLRLREPNLTLRWYPQQNPALLDLALESIGDGCIHPSLYHDDVHMQMVQRAHGVAADDALHYSPEGCGEILVQGRAFGSPNNILDLLSGLDLVLHDGVDRASGRQRGLRQGDAASFASFDALLAALERQWSADCAALAARHAVEHQVEAEHAAWLYMSMLTHDCIERSRSLFADGARYLGGIIEGFGLTNVVDSLVAIRDLVFERRVFTLPQMVAMADADYEGYERERAVIRRCPAFGNDDDSVDALQAELSRCINDLAQAHGRAAGLDFFLTCNLNPGAIHYAGSTAASLDGRRAGTPLATGNCPAVGRDRTGLTALLHSFARHDALHAGYVHNLKLTKEHFAPDHRDTTRHLVESHFAAGGSQLMITVVDGDDLQRALREPEAYGHVLVRVAGWTERFVDLTPYFQREILARTLHGAH